jgi:predicted amidophosphoribosyltransferase
MTVCAYHNDKEAVAVCSRCNRPICEADRKDFIKVQQNESGTEKRLHNVFCIPCWAEKAQKVSGVGYGFLFSGIVSLALQIYKFNWDVTPDKKIWTVTWISVSALFILIGKKIISNGRAEVKKRMAVRNRFLQLVDDGSFLVRDGQVIMNCYRCGTELKAGNMYCPNCGFTASLSEVDSQ